MHFGHIVSWKICLVELALDEEWSPVDGHVKFARACTRTKRVHLRRVWGSSIKPIIQWIAFIGKRRVKFWVPFFAWGGWWPRGWIREASSFIRCLAAYWLDFWKVFNWFMYQIYKRFVFSEISLIIWPDFVSFFYWKYF